MNQVTLVGGAILRNVHDKSKCAGEHCCIHNPSAHHMVEWDQYFDNGDKGMYRYCEHDIGHPDPDDPRAPWMHLCDGCCELRLEDVVAGLRDIAEDLS